ncbi:MAG: DUF4368 domain-containing protein [Anaerovibrio sp.]|nr:DUF4368 domain-containing protein [Anaerovibrio sp.]
MSQKYSAEQERLITDIGELEAEVNEYQRVEQDLTNWITRIKECLTIGSLTRPIVVELIDRVDVSETYDKNGEKFIDINIAYKFNPNIPNSDPQKINRAV